MTVYGYGKILDIDLSTGRIATKDIDPEFAFKFLGGMGFSCKIFFDEVPADVDPLGPENIIIFANGPLTGTPAPCAGRTEVTTKHPLNNNIGTGNTGGLWGTRLKHAGIDVLIVRGQAKNPVYLWIDDDKASIKDASNYWGHDTRESTDGICQELDVANPSSISVLTIGPGGENLVKFSCPINDFHHCTGRSGAGAVMGAKKLKGIAVRGYGNVNLARPEEFKKTAREARDRLMTADNALKNMVGFREDKEIISEGGFLPGKNYQTGVLPNWRETRGLDEAKKYFIKNEATCYACPISCFNMVEVKEGKYAGMRLSRGLHTGLTLDWGAKCAIGNLPAVWKCKDLCQCYGLDNTSTAGTVGFAMELYQRGIITKKDTDNLDLSWGNDDAVTTLIKKIAFREGFGNVLSEGSTRAAKLIGKGAEEYVMATKGMEMMLEDPRAGRRGFCFGDLTNPRGGDNIKTTHFGAENYNPNWWVDKFDMFEEVKKGSYNLSPLEMPKTWDGKPLLSRWFEDLFSVANAMGMCIFPVGAKMALGPNYLSRLYSACTGFQTSPEDIVRAGERVFTMLKACAVRQGMTRRDDTWPDRFYNEALTEGPAKDAILSRQDIEHALDEYYELRGWDKKLGVPSAEKLIDIELGDVANELIKLKKIPVK